jgi:hypothetical protein
LLRAFYPYSFMVEPMGRMGFLSVEQNRLKNSQ